MKLTATFTKSSFTLADNDDGLSVTIDRPLLDDGYGEAFGVQEGKKAAAQFHPMFQDPAHAAAQDTHVESILRRQQLAAIEQIRDFIDQAKAVIEAD